MKTGAIILAAGLSSRMGQCKPLLKVGEKTMLDHCIHLFQKACVNEIVIVVGHNSEKILQAVKEKEINVRAVENAEFQSGMFSSIRRGAESLRHCDAFFVLPVDIPLVRPATITAIIEGFDGSKSVVPSFDGNSGHPPFIAANLRDQILQTGNDGILRDILTARGYNKIKVWDSAILADADTPKAYTTMCDASLCRDILQPREAELFAEQYVPRRAYRHCQSVAAVAIELAEAMPKGSVDLDLVYSAALLHDIGKGEPNHAQAGAEILQSFNLRRIAEVVAAHKDLPPPADGKLTEKEIVCLADKMIDGTERVSLKTRFEKKILSLQEDNGAIHAIAKRLHNAQGLATLWEKTTGEKIH